MAKHGINRLGLSRPAPSPRKTSSQNCRAMPFTTSAWRSFGRMKLTTKPPQLADRLGLRIGPRTVPVRSGSDGSSTWKSRRCRNYPVSATAAECYSTHMGATPGPLRDSSGASPRPNAAGEAGAGGKEECGTQQETGTPHHTSASNSEGYGDHVERLAEY